MSAKILKYFYYIWIGGLFVFLGILYLGQKQLIFAEDFKSESLDAFVSDFYPWAITIAAGLAVIMLIYSGYLYVTSAGNMEQINKAKEFIVGALSGLAFLILAALIFQTLSVGTGSTSPSPTTPTTPNPYESPPGPVAYYKEIKSR